MTPRLSTCAAGMFLAAALTTPVPAAPQTDPGKPEPRAQPAAPPLAWGQWRGLRRDGISRDSGLARSWPKGGPPLLWQAKGLGAGFSSLVFAGDRIFTMGDHEGAAQLFALKLADGETIWSARVGKPGGTRNAGPRSTPATDGTRVFGLGQDGSLVCCAIADGTVLWRESLPKGLGGRMMSGWGFSESPLLDGDKLVCTPGGSKGTVVALDKKTGKPIWRCTALQDRAGYCSLVPVAIEGVRQYLVFTERSVAGVAAADGKLLWRSQRPGKTAVCTDPLFGDGIVFVSSAYRVGCNAFRIRPRPEGFDVEEIYAGSQIESHHGGMVLLGDHLYGLGRRNLKCIEIATGKLVWEDHSVGKGSITAADGMLIVRAEKRGAMALVEATPKGYRELGRFKLPHDSGEPGWSHPVVFGRRLYVRDQDVLMCFDLAAGK